ncbi:TonB-dependent receptor [Hellea balneolensis]|uniref:TonB-dependent receptor n=1 Tax=Hellea balneolensis TaxID=287478 RepID=UPI0003FD5730|nr:TonB-dependent receptor [Hellea balneolensis]
MNSHITSLGLRAILSTSALALTMGLTTAAHAQVTTSSMRGEIVTSSGAPVTNATIIITHEPTGTVSTVSTNNSGVFTSRGLRVGGPYTVTIGGAGIQGTTVEDIYLGVDQTYPLDVSVLGANEVVATGTILSSQGFRNEGLSTTLGLDALEEVASIDRDIADAAEQNPFVTINVQSGGSKELSIAGANNRFNTLTIDGVALNDRFGLNANGYPTQRSPISFDAIESLSVLTAPFDVEYNGFTGGTINAVTKSGKNEFYGSVFGYYTDDSFAGSKSEDREFDLSFEEKTYGGTLGGPIIKDKLFFFVSYDKFEEAATTQTGVLGSNAVNEIGVTAADAELVRSTVQNVWGFDVGGFDKSPVEDEKFLANIDWNITDNHRAKFTYLKTDGSSIREQNGNNFLGNADVAFSSSWYERRETVNSYIGHVFSDWTDNFSTEMKLAYTTQDTGQDSLNGAEFFLGAVTTPGVDGIYGNNVGADGIAGTDDDFNDDEDIAFGPDRFRHGNSLDQEFLTMKFKGEYFAGDHTFKFGFEREEVNVNNLFAQNSEGTYVFDTIDDLANAQASGLLYNNAITNDENDLRAIWGYNFNSLYVQDTYDVTSNLTVDLGLRYDFYESEGEIRENQNFINRYGFSNTNDLQGKGVWLPRFSFDLDATDNIRVRGGVGKFSGGAPTVWISNSYSNDGVINDGANAFGVVNVPTTPDAATGQFIPQAQLDALANTAPDGSVNALDESFEIPTVWKINLGTSINTNFLLEDLLLSADILYNVQNNTPYWYDLRCGQAVSAGPDGRSIYDCSSGPEALGVGSVDEGDSFLIAFSATKNWETAFGDIDMFASYTYADVNDFGGGTSSTATSNYSDSARYDFQRPDLSVGTSNFEVKHNIKLRLDWEKEFFNDLATKVSLFGTHRTGQPYSYTFSENNACVFDLGGGRCRRESRVDDAGHLLYVPSGPNDPAFSSQSFQRFDDSGNLDAAATAAAQASFFDYINSSELAQYAGGVTDRNGDTSPSTTIFDLRLQQELPGLMEGHKTKLFLDFENIGNFINSDWGRIERTRYEYERDVVSAQIDPNTNQFIYNNLQSEDRINNLEVLQQSLWQIQIGAKYEF